MKGPFLSFLVSNSPLIPYRDWSLLAQHGPLAQPLVLWGLGEP